MASRHRVAHGSTIMPNLLTARHSTERRARLNGKVQALARLEWAGCTQGHGQPLADSGALRITELVMTVTSMPSTAKLIVDGWAPCRGLDRLAVLYRCTG